MAAAKKPEPMVRSARAAASAPMNQRALHGRASGSRTMAANESPSSQYCWEWNPPRMFWHAIGSPNSAARVTKRGACQRASSQRRPASQKAAASAACSPALIRHSSRESHWPASSVTARFWSLVRTILCSLCGSSRCVTKLSRSNHGASSSRPSASHWSQFGMSDPKRSTTVHLAPRTRRKRQAAMAAGEIFFHATIMAVTAESTVSARRRGRRRNGRSRRRAARRGAGGIWGRAPSPGRGASRPDGRARICRRG